MASFLNKFQDAVRTFARSPRFTKDPRKLQFEVDINRLFMYTYNNLGKNVDEADAEQIIDMASKASFADQQKQVQENIHNQIKSLCTVMDAILLDVNEPQESQSKATPSRSGLSFAIGRNGPTNNHPTVPNVMICPYDFPLTEKDMRAYIPNLSFGNAEEVNMRRFGSFWFRWGSRNSESNGPVLKTLVLVATTALCDEEVLLNYRLSNSKRRPSWYTPVDEEEDQRRWS
ncbi:hypothetical protein GOBAR_DD09586 [Gossypium barbadense]|nr:hypothetical protein GOBAR_DD09586 [Gossypium barbadense]